MNGVHRHNGNYAELVHPKHTSRVAVGPQAIGHCGSGVTVVFRLVVLLTVAKSQ